MRVPLVALAAAVGASDVVYTSSKRTVSSSNGSADSAFFAEYFGPVDPASSHSDCLDRWLLMALPDGFGLHFPSSHATPDAPADAPARGASAPPRTLADWDAARVSRAADAMASDAWDSHLDQASAFFVPDLAAHAAALAAAGVPHLRRAATDAAGEPLWAVVVVSPGAGHALELVAPACAGCEPADFPPFGARECARAHVPRAPLAALNATWTRAAAAAWATVAARDDDDDDALPAALVTQLRAAVTDLGAAARFHEAFFEGAPLETLAPAGGGGDDDDGGGDGCAVGAAAVYSRPFDPSTPVAVASHAVELVYVQNDAQARAERAAAAGGDDAGDDAGGEDPGGFRAWAAWADALHASWSGLGFGYDRLFDYHVKVNDVGSDATTGNATLDFWAARHEREGVAYHPFNLSQTRACADFDDDGAAAAAAAAAGPPPGPSGGMIYSRGVPGAVCGFEFWGPPDGSFIDGAAHPLFGWEACAATFGCVDAYPVAACAEASPPPSPRAAAGAREEEAREAVRGRVFHDAPTGLARLFLACSEGRAIANVTFASFGTPAGECAFDGDGGGGFVATSCDDPASRAIVAAACAVGAGGCVVPTAGFARADACGDADLWLAVELECA